MATAAPVLSAYASAAERLMADNPDAFIGTLIWYSITGGDDYRTSVPVRIPPDDLRSWFVELDLPLDCLPAELTRLNAFKRATSEIKHDYNVSIRQRATLRCVEMSANEEMMLKHVMRDVIDSAGQTLTTAHIASIRFFKGSRDAAGKRKAAQHYKVVTLNTLIEVGLDNEPTGRSFEITDLDREQLDLALGRFQQRYDDLFNYVQSQTLRKMVRDLLRGVNAVQTKDSGGVYFVLTEYTDYLRRVQKLVRRIGQGCQFMIVPLLEAQDVREMVTDALADAVSVDSRKFLAQVQDVLESHKGKKIPVRTLARLDGEYQSAVERVHEYAEKLGIAQERSGAALELAFNGLMELRQRV